MAKFDPEHAVCPKTNFEDRNSAEQFLECGKFRRCANLKLIEARVPSPPMRLYLPVCVESRFKREGVAEMLDIPIYGEPLSPMAYSSIPAWAPLISCPRDCKGYRSIHWKTFVDAVRRKLGFGRRQSVRRRTASAQPQSGTLTKALSNGWVQSLGGTFIVALIAWLVALRLHTGVEAAAIAFVASAAAFVLVLLIAVARNWDSGW